MNKAETERQRMPKTYMDLCVKWAANRSATLRDSAAFQAALEAPGSTMTVGLEQQLDGVDESLSLSPISAND